MSEKILLNQEEIEMKPLDHNQAAPMPNTRSNQVLPDSEKIQTSLRDEMKSLRDSFLSTTPDTIITPFKGTALSITKDRTKYIFSSKESRIAVCDAKYKRIIVDRVVKEKEIWCMAVCFNDTVVIAAGTSGVIRKLQMPNLAEVDSFRGHSGEVNYIRVSHDDKFAYSAGDDGTVREWDLSQKSPAGSVIYTHSGRVYGMGISADSNLLCTCSSDGVMKVYRLRGDLTDCNTVLKSLQENYDSLWICRFSPDNSLVAAGSEDSNVYIWSTITWDKIYTLSGHQARVRCMNFTNSGNRLITGGIDNLMKVWDLKGKKEHITLALHSDWVRATIVSPDDMHCVSLGDDCKIIKWKIPAFDREYMLKSDNATIKHMWISANSDTIYGITDHNIIRSWESASGNPINEFQVQLADILHLTVASNLAHVYFYTPSPDPEDEETINVAIHLVSADNGEITPITIIKHATIVSSTVSQDGKFIVLGTKFTLDIYDEHFRPYHSFRTHTSDVVAVALTSDSKFLFSASSDGGLIMSNILEKKTDKKLLKPEDQRFISQLKVSKNDENLYVLHTLFVDIYSVQMRTKLFTIREPGVKHVNFSSDNSKMFMFSRHSLNTYNIDNFSLFYRQVFRAPTSYVTFANNSKYWVLYRGKDSKISPNPLSLGSFACIGQNGESLNYRQYITDIIRDKEPRHTKAFDKWIIVPNYMNALHFYAYYNAPDYLQKALEDDGPFFASKSGHTPLSIALQLKYVGCVRAVIKGLGLRLKENPLNFYYFDRSLTQLNTLGYSGLHRIYNLVFTSSINRAMPKFALEKPGEIYVENPNLLIGPTEFMPNENYATDGISIRFRQSFCKFPLVPGSDESLEFIQSLVDCKNIKIYESEIIRILLNKKWDRLRWIMIVQALIFMVFALLLSIHTVRDRNNATFIYGPLGVEVVLLLYEIFQIIVNKTEYFKDILNWVDLVKTALFVAYFIMIQMGNYENNSLLACLLFITLMRGISYFRLFSETRYYINLLYEVIFDLIPFLIIFYYSAVGFSMIFMSLDREKESDFFSYVTWGYPTDLGNYDTSAFDKADWLNYFLVTLLISIVMLSLVVSILSDTYGRVNENSLVADSQALAQMIYECELLYFWNRSKNQSKFVFLCAEQEDASLVKSNVTQKVMKLKGLVTVLSKKINSNRRLMKALKTKFVEDTEKIVSGFNDLA